MKEIVIYGASGHGKVVADIAYEMGFETILFIDDGDNDFMPFENFLQSYRDLPCALGIGNNYIRQKVFQKLIENDINIMTLVHPKAILSKSVSIGLGTVIMAGVVINADVKIGQGVIVNTSAVIEHDTLIEDFVHISPNVALAGNVKVGKYTHIGIGSSSIQNIHIGEHTTVGAGSVIVNNIEDFALVYGVPAKKIKEIKI